MLFPKMRFAGGENIVPVVLCLDYIYTDHGTALLAQCGLVF